MTIEDLFKEKIEEYKVKFGAISIDPKLKQAMLYYLNEMGGPTKELKGLEVLIYPIAKTLGFGKEYSVFVKGQVGFLGTYTDKKTVKPIPEGFRKFVNELDGYYALYLINDRSAALIVWNNEEMYVFGKGVSIINKDYFIDAINGLIERKITYITAKTIYDIKNAPEYRVPIIDENTAVIIKNLEGILSGINGTIENMQENQLIKLLPNIILILNSVIKGLDSKTRRDVTLRIQKALGTGISDSDLRYVINMLKS